MEGICDITPRDARQLHQSLSRSDMRPESIEYQEKRRSVIAETKSKCALLEEVVLDSIPTDTRRIVLNSLAKMDDRQKRELQNLLGARQRLQNLNAEEVFHFLFPLSHSVNGSEVRTVFHGNFVALKVIEEESLLGMTQQEVYNIAGENNGGAFIILGSDGTFSAQVPSQIFEKSPGERLTQTAIKSVIKRAVGPAGGAISLGVELMEKASLNRAEKVAAALNLFFGS